MMALCVNPVKGANKLGSVGMPLPDVHVRIFDGDEGTRELPANEVGEIAIAAPQLMSGYWNQPDETADVLRDHVDDGGTRRWLHTGDLGYLDEDGYLFIVDRKKDLIKTSGYQVWPREIEEAIAAHPAVAEVGVAGVPDAVKGEAVKAWVVLRAGQTGHRSRAARVLPRDSWRRTKCRRRSSSAPSCRRRWSARCCGARCGKAGSAVRQECRMGSDSAVSRAMAIAVAIVALISSRHFARGRRSLRGVRRPLRDARQLSRSSSLVAGADRRGAWTSR